MTSRRYIFALCMLTGCANHPIDCGIGFYHADCLPGTAGYVDSNAFAAVDDQQCRSYGLAFGTREYAECRERLAVQHHGPEPTLGVIVGAPK
jgi:hypothetical protein